MSLPVTIIAAVAENGIIGQAGALPWRLPSDLKRFRADTMGKPLVMGRKTFQSIGRALPGRFNIVVTRDSAFRADGVDVVATVAEALELADARGRAAGASEICVIGGGELYRQCMPLASRLLITRVLADLEGDTRFPQVDEEDWALVRRERRTRGDKDSHATRYEVWRRR